MRADGTELHRVTQDNLMYSPDWGPLRA